MVQLSSQQQQQQHGKDKTKREKSGISLVDLAYRRAKAVKAVNRAVDAGKIVRKAGKKPKPKSRVAESKMEEMQDLSQNDMREKKQRKPLHAGGKKKSSFKSKSRYDSNLKSLTISLFIRRQIYYVAAESFLIYNLNVQVQEEVNTCMAMNRKSSVTGTR